jgi:hypothetical protein
MAELVALGYPNQMIAQRAFYAAIKDSRRTAR